MKTMPLVILFADRSPGPSRRLRVELRRRGARVLLAGSTEGAIHQAALDPPDLLIMDDDLRKDGETDLTTFMTAAFPEAGIIFLRGSGPPTSSPSGLDLLLWTHKRVAHQTLIETIELAFPGRLGPATPDWRKAEQVRCVDEKPHPLKSLTRFISPRGTQASGSRVRVGKTAMRLGILRIPVPKSEAGSTDSGLDPASTPGVEEESGG